MCWCYHFIHYFNKSSSACNLMAHFYVLQAAPHSRTWTARFHSWYPRLTCCLNISPLAHSSTLQKVQTTWLPKKQHRLTWQSFFNCYLHWVIPMLCKIFKLTNSWWFRGILSQIQRERVSMHFLYTYVCRTWTEFLKWAAIWTFIVW